MTGVFPIAPTPFHDDESIDLDGQARVIEFLIDAGVDGICILANYSEQFALTDDERQRLQTTILRQVDGRVPVIVTTSHYTTRIAADRSRRAQDEGASMVMLMPPYHGATLRIAESQITDYFRTIADQIEIPIMIQDAPMSGTPLSADILAALAREIPSVQYVKVESANAAAKLKRLIDLAGDSLPGPFDGEESVTLIPDLEAGATGTMPSSAIPEVLGEIVRDWLVGDREKATSTWESWLPMIHYENRQCNLRGTKILMREGGIIGSARTRDPFGSLPPEIAAGYIAHARRRDPLVLRWAR
ncbi:MAG TPA: dihydrodipicolinate synthase family protein [Thermomicrobiales bacterium]|nr:dihydrodipicolinate synthase family protein [Thermomicrobiales bacterium]